MNAGKNNNGVSAGRWLSVGLMVFCLTFLTSINYFQYPSDCSVSSANFLGADTEDTDNNFPPSGPTEEKSSGSQITVAEEMLHEMHPEVQFGAGDYLYLHHIAEAENIEMFHPELILPPPKL